jgi:hypothetical protein
MVPVLVVQVVLVQWQIATVVKMVPVLVVQVVIVQAKL